VWGGVIVYALVTIAVYFLIIVLMKQRVIKNLPIRVKIGLAIYAVYAPFTFGLFLTLIIRKDWYTFFTLPGYRCAFMASITMFLVNHWQFAASYLKTSTLFRRIF